MSEEEIIKVLKCEDIFDTANEGVLELLNEENDYDLNILKQQAVQGLLDLYNKEKAKNKELLEGLKYRVNYCKLLEKELYNNGVNYNIELTKVEQDYLQDLLEENNK